MKKNLAWLTGLCSSFLIIASARAQTEPVSGLYQIVSGRYTECCGIAATDSGYDLPSPNQRFVRLSVDPQTHLATLTFLAEDAQTVFAVIPCPPSAAINFSFDYGLVFSNHVEFHVDPGPPPFATYWDYTVSNLFNGLRIDGTLNTLQTLCFDVPTHFGHTNVAALLLPTPRLSMLDFSTDRGARLFLQGQAGHTSIIYASEDLVTWTPVSTNVMDYTLCPICPYMIFEDRASTNLPQRFYRASELP